MGALSRQALGFALLSVGALVGCGTDLPRGWSNAKQISEFTQMQCHGSPSGGPDPEIHAAGIVGGVEVDYEHAGFRCGQDVEGFLRRSGSKLDVLVQPEDMDPSSVTKCDCLYHIAANLSVDPGKYKVTVYRRGDNINHPNDPMLVGEEEVVVPEK